MNWATSRFSASGGHARRASAALPKSPRRYATTASRYARDDGAGRCAASGDRADATAAMTMPATASVRTCTSILRQTSARGLAHNISSIGRAPRDEALRNLLVRESALEPRYMGAECRGAVAPGHDWRVAIPDWSRLV